MTYSHSQNLVPNSGFELIDCPSEITINTIFYAKNWFDVKHSKSADSYHECYNESAFTPPENASGFSFPQYGKGMAGFIPFLVAETNDSREVLSVRLTEAMIKDSAYCVSFFVKNSFFSDIEYGTDNIGVLFTSDTITKEQVLTQSAHVRSKDGILLLDNDWIKISGYYVAKGGEKFLNIGTFGSRDSMDYFWGGASHLPNGLPSHLYYFVDEVSVNLCDKDSLMNIVLEVPNIFTPDGDGYNDFFSMRIQNINTLNVTIISRWVNTLLLYDGLTYEWDGSIPSGKPVNDGVYFYMISGVDNNGFPIDKNGTITVVRKP